MQADESYLATKSLTPERTRLFRVKLPSGETREVREGTSVSELVPRTSPGGLPVVAVRFNNKVASLARAVDRDAEIDVIDLASRDGGLIYRRSLTFLLIRAVHDLYPDLKLYINHSLNRGYYGEVYNEALGETTPMLLAPTDVERHSPRRSRTRHGF